ncbi:MAG: NAD-dependent epimerase/dehydratase family protein [Actinomycetota bacterium]|jgi:UDP-glucose 4-epimerase|nr:NAD-dependent epimerase/dehydratase family protein [Actinomycetota bacterium]
MGRRVLVTGADTHLGGRVVQRLEADSGIDVVLGLGTGDPKMGFERAELVRSDQTYSTLSRIVRATRVDTVVHTSLIADSTQAPSHTIHEVNVIGTMNLLAAADAADSSVRQLVVRSSGVVYGSAAWDPATFAEDTPRTSAPRTDVERSLIEAEALVRDFADHTPSTVVAILRVADVLGSDVASAIGKNLSRPLCPYVLGFDPLLQFVEEDDVVRALEFVTRHRLAGTYNVAGAGRLPLSEVAAICGTRLFPLPPVRPSLAIAPLVHLGIFGLPPELEALLRYGRGMDTSRLVAAGFVYRYTSSGAVQSFASFARSRRLRKGAGRQPAGCLYEHDVEQCFRHPPSVVQPSGD